MESSTRGNSSRPSREKQKPTKSQRGSVGKKRAQNRVAQKGFRDKQQAYLHHLESFVETVKQTNVIHDETTRYHTLLRSHLELAEENHRLQEALIQLRQKLACIGQSALAVAEDDSIESLIKIGRNHGDIRSQEDHSAARKPSPTPQHLRGLSTLPGDLTTQGNCDKLRSSVQKELQNVIPLMPEPLLSDHAQTPADISTPVVFNLGLTGFESLAEQYLIQTSEPNLLNNSLTLANNTTSINSKTMFADKVVSACRRYMSQVSAKETSQVESLDHQLQIVSQVSRAAIRLIGEQSGLIPYIYGSDFFKCLERIMQWRLHSNMLTRLAIPEPFRATPLQYSSLDYPVIIDFITWPSIRDQMILHRSTLDIDKLCRDLTVETVIEIPHVQVSLCVYDFVHHTMSASQESHAAGQARSCLDNPDWVFVQMSVESQFSMSLDPVVDQLLHEIAARVCSNTIESRPLCRFPERQSAQNKSQLGLTDHAPGYPIKINQMDQWKLSKNFARAWPSLDCSAVLSKYDKISYATLLGLSE